MGRSKENDEEMTVELDLEDGSKVVCAIITILTLQNQDYIALLPPEKCGSIVTTKMKIIRMRNRN